MVRSKLSGEKTSILSAARMVSERRKIGGRRSPIQSPYAGWRDYFNPVYSGVRNVATYLSPPIAWDIANATGRAAAYVSPKIWSGIKYTAGGLYKGGRATGRGAWLGTKMVGRATKRTARGVYRGAAYVSPKIWSGMKYTAGGLYKGARATGRGAWAGTKMVGRTTGRVARGIYKGTGRVTGGTYRGTTRVVSPVTQRAHNYMMAVGREAPYIERN